MTDYDIDSMYHTVYQFNEADTSTSILIYFQHIGIITSGVISCSCSVLVQVGCQLALTLSLCLLCRLLFSALAFFSVRRVISDSTVQLLFQFGSTVSGILLLHYFYADSASVILGFFACLGIWFLLIFIWLPWCGFNARSFNPTLSLVFLCLAVQFYCEFNMDRVKWHQLRGSVMLIVMKAISFSLDFCESPDKWSGMGLPGWLSLTTSWSAYSLCPATAIFGPWHPVDGCHWPLTKVAPVPSSPSDRNAGSSETRFCWLWDVSVAVVTALFCLLWSTCLLNMFTPDLREHRWLEAYVASQGFRFSHYFVSYSSEAFVATFGGFTAVGDTTSDGGSSPLRVTRLWTVEWPRSLGEVVISWSLPMHSWLKRYVYRPVRPYGRVWAILATYTASSLLHGVNFQLSAVLLSIGTFAYVEYMLREKLARLFNACIMSRQCLITCRQHRYKSNRWGVRLTNLCFTLLSVFQLAYLAVMFDTSEEQLQGYSMRHALGKWAHLDFIGHYVALVLLLVCLPVSLLPGGI